MRINNLVNLVWAEKYRPKDFDEVVGLPDSLKNITEKNLTHMLFVGKPGVGKTTCALIIASKFATDFLELNASDERGIDVIRTKVKFFAEKFSYGRKILLLDEADGITPSAQDSLRRVMENTDTIFILTANYVNKIIEAIRSRCMIVEFLMPDKNEIFDRLCYICKTEGVKFNDDDIRYVIDIFYPDIRRMINAIQGNVIDNMLKLERISATDVFDAIYCLIEQGDLRTLRQVLREYSPDYNQLYSYLFDRVFESTKTDDVKKEQLLIISEYMYRNSFVSDPEINFLAMSLKLNV